MKKIYYILLLLICFCLLPSSLRASHIIGSEINYRYLYGNTYRITLKVYRDCRECKFNGNGGGDNNTNCNDIPGIVIRGSRGTQYQDEELATVSMTRVSIRTVTPTCPSVTGACEVNTSYPLGIEEHVLEADYDFSTLIMNNTCRLDLSISIASRNKSINNLGIEQNFYNYSSIDLCNGKKNSSVQFNNDPFFILNLNQPVYYSPAAFDSDADSLSFKLSAARSNPAQEIMYATGKTYTRPLNIYCGSGGNPQCIADPTKSMPEGLYIDRITGDIIFTPIQMDDKGVFVLEAEEWRKNIRGVYEKIGVVRRDIYVEVPTFNNNSPLFRNQKFTYAVCAGESVCFDIDAKDLATPAKASDTVKFKYIASISGATFKTAGINNPPYTTSTFCWIPKPSDARSLPYTFTVVLKDNACPLNATTSRTFTIYVYDKDHSSIDVKLKECGEISVENITSGQRDNSTVCWWEVYNQSNELLVAEQGYKRIIKLPKGGRYYVVNKISNVYTGCQTILKDTVDVPAFSMPKLNMGPDLSLCPNVPYKLSPQQLVADNPYTVFNGTEEVSFPFDLPATSSDVYTFTVRDNNGCETADRIQVTRFPELKAVLNPISICANLVSPLKLDDYLVVQKSETSSIVFSSSSSDVKIYENAGAWYFESLSKVPATVPLLCTITDNNGCKVVLAGSVVLVKPMDIRYSQLRNICLNENPVNLRIETEIQIEDGTWSMVSNPAAISGNMLLPSAFTAPGTHILQYHNDNNGCPLEKNISVTLVAPPAISFTAPLIREACKTGPAVALAAAPANGRWYGNGVSGTSFNPSSAAVPAGRTTVYYTAEDRANKCSSTDSFYMQVNTLPVLNLASAADATCESQPLEIAASNDKNITMIWTAGGNGQLNMVDPGRAIYVPSKEDATAGSVTVTVKVPAQGGCPEVVKTIAVRIKSLPQGSISVAAPASLCEPANFTFSSNHTSIDRQQWLLNGKEAADFGYGFPLQTTLSAGTYILETVVEEEGCRITVKYPSAIEVYETPESRFITDPADMVSREYPRVRIEDRTDCKDDYSREWSIGKRFYSNESDFYVTLPGDTDAFTFTLTTRTLKGCSNTYSRVVRFAPNSIIFVPTAFSPDSKGPEVNNLFQAQGPEMKLFSMMILNRNGEVVYKSSSMSEGWDGTYMNAPASAGTYVYKILATDRFGKEFEYAGTVTLLR